MITKPTNWDNLIQQEHIFQYKLVIGSTVCDSSHLLSVPTGTDRLMDSFSVGNAVIQEKSFALIDSPATVSRGSRVEVWARVKTATSSSGYAPIGVYYARKPKTETLVDVNGTSHVITTFNGYDEMAKLLYIPYGVGTVIEDWNNKTARQVAQIISTQCGLALEDATQVPTYIMPAPPFGFTAQEIMGDIAKTVFGNWILTYVNTNGSIVPKLRLVKFDFEADPDDNVLTTNSMEALAFGNTTIKVGY